MCLKSSRFSTNQLAATAAADSAASSQIAVMIGAAIATTPTPKPRIPDQTLAIEYSFRCASSIRRFESACCAATILGAVGGAYVILLYSYDSSFSGAIAFTLSPTPAYSFAVRARVIPIVSYDNASVRLASEEH